MFNKEISKNYSTQISIVINLVIIAIFFAFIYSANNIINLNNEIQEQAFQNRFNSRLLFKTISNLRTCQVNLSDYIYSKDIKRLEAVEDHLLSAKSDYNVLLSEKAAARTLATYQSRIPDFDILIDLIERNFAAKSYDHKLTLEFSEKLDSLIMQLYKEESDVWNSESKRFTRLTQFRATSRQTFFYLTIMFAFFILTFSLIVYLRSKLVAKINQQNEQLILQARMSTLGVMSAELAHEINSPLMVIDGRVKQISNEISDSDFDKERLKKNFEIIQRNTKRIHTIVKNFKLLSKDGKLDSPEPIKLSDILLELNEIIQARAEHFQVRATIQEVPEEILIPMIKVQILQILVNLVNNSIDAINHLEEKWIEVTYTKNDRMIFIYITDSGLGISPAIVEKLFAPFFTTKNSNEGTGLGLSLSKKIAEEHRGDLVYNKSAQRTQFILSLPLN